VSVCLNAAQNSSSATSRGDPTCLSNCKPMMRRWRRKEGGGGVASIGTIAGRSEPRGRDRDGELERSRPSILLVTLTVQCKTVTAVTSTAPNDSFISFCCHQTGLHSYAFFSGPVCPLTVILGTIDVTTGGQKPSRLSWSYFNH
jgi:hypothetical protein